MRENFYPFLLEREMGIWEHKVAYNLSESGVQPLTTRDLFEGDRELMDAILGVELNYIQSNGSIQLREQIARIHPGAKSDDVLVTVGAAQANFTSLLTLLDPGDEIADTFWLWTKVGALVIVGLAFLRDVIRIFFGKRQL